MKDKERKKEVVTGMTYIPFTSQICQNSFSLFHITLELSNSTITFENKFATLGETLKKI